MIKPTSCKGCPLGEISQGFSVEEGTGSCGVAIIGEALGYNEYLDGKPFRPTAAAGSMLEEAFKLVGRELGWLVTRDQFVLYNLVNCRPPGDRLGGEKYEAGAVAHCAPNRHRVLSGFNARGGRVVLALGNLPMKYLTGVSGEAKEKQSISHLRGFVFKSEYGLVVPSFHPSYLRRGNPHLMPLLVIDIKKALAIAQGVYKSYPSHPEYKPPHYQTTPGLDEARSFYYRVKDSQRLVLAYDIETQETPGKEEDERDEFESMEVSQVQFSLGKGTGIAFPYTGEYKAIAHDILDLEIAKAGHNNFNFDNVILREKEGVRVRGLVHDTMWMWKHWSPRLPRGLQSVAGNFGFPFPWKHLFESQLAYYGIADVDAVQWILAVLPRLMVRSGVWEGYRRHVLGTHVVFDRAREVGIPVNEGERQKLEEQFCAKRKELDKKLQGVIPLELRNIHPKRKDKVTGEVSYGYIRQPKIVNAELSRYQALSACARAMGKEPCDYQEWLARKHHLVFSEVIKRWCVIAPFKASRDQLVKYLRWQQKSYLAQVDKLVAKREEQFGGRSPELTKEISSLRAKAVSYSVPIDLKTKRETTNKEDLADIYQKTQDEVLGMVTSIRSLDTNINNYLANWHPGKDGRVHPTFGFTAPQGQINTWHPNAQNVSKHTEFGQEFRRVIEAPQGYCFVEADKRSFHVGTMGYLADDAAYIRFSQLDPHSILGSHIDPSVLGGSISMKWSDQEIKDACKTFKQTKHGADIRRRLAKPTVLGNQLGLYARKLQRQNRQYIHWVTRQERESQRGVGYSAEELQGMLHGLFPSIRLFQDFIRQKAHVEKYLIDEWGRIQYFYDVFVWTYDKHKLGWVTKEGDGAREPVAFRVQGTAFGMIMDELLELERRGACEEHNFVMTIHDSLIFMPEVGKRDKCIEIVKEVMSAPCKRLANRATGPEGLRIGVGFAVGRNWKSRDEANPEGMEEIKT